MKVVRLALVPVCAALCAALVAHIAIDVAGDYLLAHDTYDNIAHGSRSVAALAALVLITGIALAALCAAVREARGSEDFFCSAMTGMLPKRFTHFAGVVVPVSFLGLAAMESLDNVIAGNATADLGDLFGGSLLLGFSLALILSLLTSAFVWAMVRLVARERRIFVGLAIAFVRRVSACTGAACIVRRPLARVTVLSDVYGYVHAGRAPPRSYLTIL